MRRLIGAELRRVLVRMMTMAVGSGMIALCLLLALAAWSNARPPSAQETAELRASFDAAVTDWQQHGDEYIAQCEEDEKAARATDPGADLGCSTFAAPQWEDWAPNAVTWSNDAVELVVGLDLLIAGATFLIGASAVGAEFATGSISTLLTFEPRRGRVFTAKMIGVAGAALLVSVIAEAVILGALAVTYASSGIEMAATASALGHLAWTALRIVVLAVAAAWGGAALAFLSRHTAAALALVVGWAVVVEGILIGLLHWLKPWSLILSITAFVAPPGVYRTRTCEQTSTGGLSCMSVTHDVSMLHGGLVVGGLLVVVVVAAAWVFRKRDVG